MQQVTQKYGVSSNASLVVEIKILIISIKSQLNRGLKMRLTKSRDERNRHHFFECCKTAKFQVITSDVPRRWSDQLSRRGEENSGQHSRQRRLRQSNQTVRTQWNRCLTCQLCHMIVRWNIEWLSCQLCCMIVRWNVEWLYVERLKVEDGPKCCQTCAWKE